MRSSLRLLRRSAFLGLVFACAMACGSRTGLFGDEDPLGPDPRTDGGPIGSDGSADRPTPPDALPPPLDVQPPVDVIRTDCPDADATLIYTITATNELQSFDPDTGTFRLIGRIACPAGPDSNPFSMAVDRRGIAYVLFTPEARLYRVSTATGACLATSYVPRQSNFGLFGMGFATNAAGPTETLYVAGDDNQSEPGASGLARITPGTFSLDVVGEFNPLIDQAELTGTGDGRLFAFYKKGTPVPDPDTSYIGQIDTETAQVIGERRFNGLRQGSGWAFAYWGGDFYMFHAPPPSDTTVVTRWRPSDDSVRQVASTNLRIVGAGVSTCAPQQ